MSDAIRLKKHLIRFFIYTLFLVVAFFSLIISVQVVAEPNTILMNDSRWPPFFFAGDQLAPPGAAKEILEICFDETGYPVEFTFFPINLLHKYLEIGRLDLNVYSFKPQREAILYYGKEALYRTSYRPFVRWDSPIQIKSLRDFDNLVIGHLEGVTYSERYLAYLRKKQAQGKVLTVRSNVYGLTMLIKKRIDILVEADSTIFWFAKQLGVTDKIKMLDFDIRTADYFLTVSKKSRKIKDPQKFLAKIDECIRGLKKDGRYAEIMKKYGLEY
ncbi:substrate-binding periplasmic protein [candidate division CSSED10-310 bacterium]|uniref:Substrate-binding periplasmic protein n=1 Tax=candidate division CSSED10-310 bacterium TaxID=2855610 RepID=A0ABV6Z5P2_UNCC1